MADDALPENRNKLENDTVGRHDEEEISISLLSQDHASDEEDGHPKVNEEPQHRTMLENDAHTRPEDPEITDHYTGVFKPP